MLSNQKEVQFEEVPEKNYEHEEPQNVDTNQPQKEKTNNQVLTENPPQYDPLKIKKPFVSPPKMHSTNIPTNPNTNQNQLGNLQASANSKKKNIANSKTFAVKYLPKSI